MNKKGNSIIELIKRIATNIISTNKQAIHTASAVQKNLYVNIFLIFFRIEFNENRNEYLQ